jgi:deoxyadenosine/deoxycytidine kinase
MIVSVEGNIGSGKSTLVHYLKNEFQNDDRFIFIQEPVDLWLQIKDKNDESILSKFYKDQEKYGFAFQIMSYTTKLHLIRRELKKYKEQGKIIITERCVRTDKEIFAKMLHDDNKIDDIMYCIYHLMFEEFVDEADTHRYIYVKTDPSICHQRVQKRKRDGEKSISHEYLERCDKYHDEWMDKNDEVLLLDGNNEFENNEELLEMWKNWILNFAVHAFPMQNLVSNLNLAVHGFPMQKYTN